MYPVLKYFFFQQMLLILVQICNKYKKFQKSSFIIRKRNSNFSCKTFYIYIQFSLLLNSNEVNIILNLIYKKKPTFLQQQICQLNLNNAYFNIKKIFLRPE